MPLPSTCLETAPGRGWLARRPDALLWSPAAECPVALLDALFAASSAALAVGAVTAAVVAAEFAVEPFAVVVWSEGLHVVVLGDVEVVTDVASLPMLSGRASATWVEHRADATAATVSAGAPADAGGDLTAGVARAGGFRLTLGRPATVAADDRQAAAYAAPSGAPPRSPSPEIAANGAGEPGVVGDEVGASVPQGAALLDLLTGGDWMEEPIGLNAPEPLTAVGDEDEPAPLPPPRTDRPRPVVAARVCPQGHPNPPASARCGRCGDLLDAAHPVQDVPQPALGRLVTDDGAALPINGVVVVGRRPTAAAARVDGPATLCEVPAAAGVSRTHVVVRAEGWTLTVTDCGSTSGSFVVPTAGGTRQLEPWIPDSVAPGDVLHLGGPTRVRIEAPTP